MAKRTCSVDVCVKEAKAPRGWCWAHYHRWRATGDVQAHIPVLPVYRGPASGRLAERTDTSAGPDGCWVWTGHCTADGYGRLRHEGKMSSAHRVAYLLHVGPIPEGLYVLHSCDNPPCVNPAHLWLGTQADNIRDMDEKGRRRHWSDSVTHCPQGHPYDEANTYVNPTNRSRQCRACAARREREKRARRADPNFDRSEQGRRNMHLRWHERRGIVKPGCKFCPESDGTYECPP